MAKTKTADTDALPEPDAPDPLMDDLVLLHAEWTTKAKSQNLMADELAAVMAKHGYVKPEEAPAQ